MGRGVETSLICLGLGMWNVELGTHMKYEIIHASPPFPCLALRAVLSATPSAPLPSWLMARAERTLGSCVLEVVEEAKLSL